MKCRLTCVLGETSVLAQGKDGAEDQEESAEERPRRRAYERGCQRLKKRIEGQPWQ